MSEYSENCSSQFTKSQVRIIESLVLSEKDVPFNIIDIWNISSLTITQNDEQKGFLVTEGSVNWLIVSDALHSKIESIFPPWLEVKAKVQIFTLTQFRSQSHLETKSFFVLTSHPQPPPFPPLPRQSRSEFPIIELWMNLPVTVVLWWPVGSSSPTGPLSPSLDFFFIQSGKDEHKGERGNGATWARLYTGWQRGPIEFLSSSSFLRYSPPDKQLETPDRQHSRPHGHNVTLPDTHTHTHTPNIQNVLWTFFNIFWSFPRCHSYHSLSVVSSITHFTE